MNKPSSVAQSHRRTVKLPLGGINAALFIGALVLIVLETVLTNAQVASGSQVNALQQQKTQLGNQVNQLKKEVGQYKSLHRIENQATTKLGMQPLAQNSLHLPNPTPQP